VVISNPPPPQFLLSIEYPSSCICYLPMLMVDLRNVVGETIHALVNRVLANHIAKTIHGNTNWCKYLTEGTVLIAYNGRKAGAKNTLWKLTLNFLMPSEEPDSEVEIWRVEILRQHCTLGPIPVGANPMQIVSFTDTIGNPDHAVKVVDDLHSQRCRKGGRHQICCCCRHLCICSFLCLLFAGVSWHRECQQRDQGRPRACQAWHHRKEEEEE